MNKYIFLSDEGYTYQPIIEGEIEADDVDNTQVIGFASGKDQDDAFKKLLEDNPYIKDTSFDQIYCYKLDTSYEKTRVDYFLSEYKTNKE